MCLANRTLVYTDTISTTFEADRPFGHAMKPRIQCVRTPWMSGFMTSGNPRSPAAADVRLIGEAGWLGSGYGTSTVRSPGASGWGQISSTSASGIVVAVTAIVPAVISATSAGSSAR